MRAAKFKFTDATTWSPPAADFEMDDPDLGKIRVQIWHNLHLRKAAPCPMRIARIQRPESKGRRRLP